MGAPVVTPLTSYVLLNQSVLASTLFTASDPDNDPITQYRFTDLSAAGSTGFFRYNGVPRPQGSTTTVASADLSKLSFVSGSLIGNENIRVEVFANGEWSAAVLSQVFFVRDNITPPIVTTSNPTVLQDEVALASTFISAADPDGWPIQKFFIRDTKTGAASGTLRLNGVELAQGTYHTVTAASFAGLDYLARNYTENEKIEVFAWDGTMWSAYKFAAPNVLRNANVPTAFFGDVAVASNISSPIVHATGWNDPDGNTVKLYQFMDTTVGGGNLELFGSALAPNVWHSVTTANLGSMRFLGAGTNTQDDVKYRVWDGRFWSNVADLRVRTVVRPELADSFTHQTSLWNVPAVDFVDKLDIGPAFQRYEVVDLNGNSLSGFLRKGNQSLAANVVHTINANELGQLTFRTGRPEVRSTDTVLIRAFNGTFWGNWAKAEFHTEPNYRHALKQLDNPFNLSTMEANDWNDWLPLINFPRSVLTYSFAEQFDGNDFDGATADNFSQFTVAQRAMARESFRQVEEFAEFEFVEVPDSSGNVYYGVGGTVRMSNYFNPDGEAAAYASFPGIGEFNGHIKMNTAFTSISQAGTQPGTPTFETFIHELGHVMGLKHPHEQQPRLPDATDNPLFSVMSYNFNPNFQTLSASYHSPYDVLSIQDLYGANLTTRTGDDVYSINGFFGGNANWMGTIWDAGGNDTLSAAGAQQGSIVDLRQGRQSSFGTSFDFFTGLPSLTRDHVAIAFNCNIENAVGSSFGDVLTGNFLDNSIDGGLGADTITGGGGDDQLVGGGSDDTFIWGHGEGNDFLNEQGLGGRDRIRLNSSPMLDDFASDLSFRRLGRDLIVELAVENNLVDDTFRISNQQWGGYRVETIEFNGVNVDLTSVFAQATSVSKKFSISASTSVFGFIATPV
jgi:serralysin